MQFIEGKNRTQSILFPETLDQIIEHDNEVRIIDLFVEGINLTDFKFIIKTTKEGRPAYHPKDLLKLFLYGYLNHIRSSRQLEKECKRNIEVLWLMKQLAPDHNTISNFRRDNEKVIRKVFRHTVSIAKHFDLIGGEGTGTSLALRFWLAAQSMVHKCCKAMVRWRRYFIYDHEKKEWEHYVTFAVPEANAMLHGDISSFLENFGDETKSSRSSYYNLTGS
ncbi:MAG: transposase [Chitinophagaceae bacterium]